MYDNSKALEYAGKALSYRMLSEKQLRDKILQKGFSEENAEYVLEKCREYGAVNDEEYCEGLIRSYRAKGYGKRRIAQKLKESGIDREIADIRLEDFNPDYDKMQKYISSKIKCENPDSKLVKKVYDGLLRKGFSYEQAKEAINKFLNGGDNYE